ncbi:MAG TPA: TIGR03118 family protein [Pseudonocardiaceae bacterium]|nr:TIGR03118 family protein [Pseudonocardiaceae bacterium]
MSILPFAKRSLAVVAAAAGAGGLLFAGLPATASPAHGHGNPFGVSQVNLVSDLPGMASDTDSALVNPWGLALSPTSPLWSANAGTSTSTLYSSAADSTTASTVGAVRVTIPGSPAGLPTGQVFNGGTGFVNTVGAASGPARFIFSTISGNIVAWAPGVDPSIGAAEIKASTPGAAYTGLALATDKAGGQQLYAANFGQSRVDVFSSTFQPVAEPSWAFRDAFVPKKFAPFNTQTINGNVFVTYAEPNPATGREVVGKGLGIVDEFTPDGRLVARIATGGALNAPWGVAIAPSSWGKLAGSLLIGNFGDGRVNVLAPLGYGRFTPFAVGQLRDSTTGKPFAEPGLWALLPGTAATGGTDSIFFSAGIDGETHGLIGVLRKS